MYTFIEPAGCAAFEKMATFQGFVKQHKLGHATMINVDIQTGTRVFTSIQVWRYMEELRVLQEDEVWGIPVVAEL